MTRLRLHGMLAGVAFVMGSSAPDWTLAQSGETAQPKRAPSGYLAAGTSKAKPAAGAKSQPTGGTPTVSKGPVYGPVAPRSEPRRVQGGESPVRRVGGAEPVREPVGGADPGGAPPAKAGAPQGALGKANNPIPVPAQITPRQPDWYPLAPNVQSWVDEVLIAWEKTSEEIITFKCNFKRWEHDPAFGPQDPKIPYTYGEGVIQYAKPDKGMFKVESLVKYSAPKIAGGKPEWLEQIGEQWICDGRSIFEFDLRSKPKLLIQRILPKEMQGQAIADGPLPFLFGAKVSTIKARYWIRPSQDVPAGHEGEYWLEAVPRFSRDAANFQQVTIILDEKDFLPKALDVFAPNYHKKTNPAHTAYTFDKRETTLKANKLSLEALNEFMSKFKKQFYEPAVPSGWKKVVEDMNQMPQGPLPVQGPAPAPGTATRPAGTKTKTK
jgi:TIGR03009 family protein